MYQQLRHRCVLITPTRKNSADDAGHRGGSRSVGSKVMIKASTRAYRLQVVHGERHGGGEDYGMAVRGVVGGWWQRIHYRA